MRAVLARYLQVSGTKALVSLLMFLVLGAITQGIAFTLVVPITDDLLTPDTPVPWSWIAVLVAITVVHSVLHYLSVPMGNRIGADLVTTLHRAVADRASALPTRSLGPVHADRLASLDGSAVVVLMGLPAHVLRPLVAAVVTPLTVIVISLFVEPLLAATLAGGLLVVVAASFATARLLTRDEEPDGPEWLRRAYESPSGAFPHGGRPGVLLPAVGQVLLWRVVELAVCGAVAVCAVLSTGDDVSAAQGVALIVLSALTFRPVMEAALLTSTVVNSRATLSTVGRLIGAGDPEPPTDTWPAACDVEFEDVGVAVGGATVLTGVSFRLAAGTTAALTGTPDGVRLTLADLLTGDLRPTSGRVLIGGVDVATIAASEAERRVCRVSPVEGAGSAGSDGSDGVAGSSPSLADRWRLALEGAIAADPALVVVDATAGAEAFATAPDLAELLSTLVRDRTCLVIPGAGLPLPHCDEELVVEGARVAVRATEVR
nr:transporter [Streptomyces sp.]